MWRSQVIKPLRHYLTVNLGCQKGNIHYLLHISLGSNWCSFLLSWCSLWQEWAVGSVPELWALCGTHTQSRFCSLCLQEILGFHILALSLWPVSHCTAGGCWVLLRCSLRWSSYLAAQKMLMPCWLLALCTSWNKSLQATERKCHMVIALETRGPCQHWLEEQHFLWCRVIDTEPWRRLNPQVRETAG